MRDGEAAFAKNDYDAAIGAYSGRYQVDPKKYAAVLFIGDSYFAKKDFLNATTWYERAIAIQTSKPLTATKPTCSSRMVTWKKRAHVAFRPSWPIPTPEHLARVAGLG